jgi:hypothetical protein
MPTDVPLTTKKPSIFLPTVRNNKTDNTINNEKGSSTNGTVILSLGAFLGIFSAGILLLTILFCLFGRFSSQSDKPFIVLFCCGRKKLYAIDPLYRAQEYDSFSDDFDLDAIASCRESKQLNF